MKLGLADNLPGLMLAYAFGTYGPAKALISPFADPVKGSRVGTDRTTKRANIRLKNFVSVSLSSHRPRVKVMEVCAAIHHDACPYHYPHYRKDVFP
ncbi:hypothetical protein TNCV_1937771 [Trichonephila clavipes]|nr:hypothetical protein TNCV_1937771 [Trichonephila clavipes]